MPQLWADDLPAHRALVLGRLLDAYAELVGQVGFDGVTLAAVAERAEIARSAVYNYVSDRHDLALAHAEREMSRFLGVMAEAVGAEADPAGQLRAYVTTSLAQAADSVGDELMPLLTDDERGRVMIMLAPLRDVLHDIVDRGVAQGDFSGDVDALSDLVWATIAGYRMPIAHGQVDPDTAAATASHVLLAGLAS
ncbi:TetR/AcrR family transcriptional regulator [Euzebya tangerina]|uniref:TetR/AcrR family transcriptional regulator n=1 Tax=Euzebya tangerina TaxID=591198 RepID=UPI000E31B748|nr:TetR/AcrR family transcriptional regulator [Euzebya tangerina]